MAEKPGPFVGLDDATVADRGLGSLGDDESILSDVFDDIEPGPAGPGLEGGPRMPSIVDPPELQNATQSTQECMRGPCEHHWRMLMRMDAQSEIITVQRVQYCTRHVELMNLHNENAYECDCWWPIPLLFVPAALRPLLRPLLRELWDRWLKAKGETFDWRWWPRNVFDLDPDTVHELRQAAVRRRRERELAESLRAAQEAAGYGDSEEEAFEEPPSGPMFTKYSPGKREEQIFDELVDESNDRDDEKEGEV